MMLNPINEEAGPLRGDDQLILLSRIFPSGSKPLPISPAIAPAQEEKKSK